MTGLRPDPVASTLREWKWLTDSGKNALATGRCGGNKGFGGRAQIRGDAT